LTQIDKTDKKILELLQHNSKITYKEIGEKLDMAASTIHHRVKKLEKNGVIINYTINIDPFKVGHGTIALLGLSVDPLKMKQVVEELAKFDQIQLVVTTSGDHDVVVQMMAKNDKKLWRFINEHIKTIEGIRSNIDVSSFIDIAKMTNDVNIHIE